MSCRYKWYMDRHNIFEGVITDLVPRMKASIMAVSFILSFFHTNSTIFYPGLQLEDLLFPMYLGCVCVGVLEKNNQCQSSSPPSRIIACC